MPPQPHSASLPAPEAGSFAGGETRHAVRQPIAGFVTPFAPGTLGEQASDSLPALYSRGRG